MTVQGDVPEWARDRLVLFPAAVPSGVCERIATLGRERPLTAGPLYDEVKGERIVDPTVRMTSVGWFVEKDWIYELMYGFASRVNAVWGFDINDNDPMQFAAYRRGDFFEWHKDMLRIRRTIIRKISVVLQLDAPDAYSGGKLEFLDNDHGVFVPKAFDGQGSVAVFSTLLKHRVTPIKHGERRSLTAWFKGPSFR
jgi:PKHD-type hydroxylase